MTRRFSISSLLVLLICSLMSFQFVMFPDRGFADEDPMNPGIDVVAFEAALKSTGVEGWVHGRLGTLAVFVYREKGDFFRYAHFPVVSHIPGVKAELERLARHDKIRIKGEFIENGAPQKHIYVTELQTLERWDGGGGNPVPPYEYEAKIPEELMGRSEFIGKVHFAAQDGSMVVCEYKDVVIPVVGIPGRANNLYRGDKVKIHFKIQSIPRRPSHLVLNDEVASPVEVLERLVDLHDKFACVEGTLVKFPKSPDVSFDVFALQRTDNDHVTLDYTLVNFDNVELFKEIRQKSAAAWDAHPESVINGRNKLHNPRLHVKACGTLNVVAPSQANPQILIDKIEDLTIDFR
jgi:hypothetical protein